MLLEPAVLDKDLTVPPGSPSVSDRWIVGPSATGAWAGHDDAVAYWDGGQWTFIGPWDEMMVWVADEATIYRYTPSGWTAVAAPVVTHSEFWSLI